MLGAYPIATRPLATLQEVAGPTGASLWINTRLELDGTAESGIVQNFWGAGAISLFGHVYDPIALPPAYVDSTIQQPTPLALVAPVHQTYSDATIVIDPSGDAIATPDHRIFSDSIYAYRPGIEQHYIQTNGSPDFMWAPSGADGVENANGIYTLFVKVLQTDPRTTDYWRFMNLYDNAGTNELQTTDYIAQLYTYDDRILFGGNRSTSGLNYQFQPAATSAGAQGIQVFSTRVNLNTNRVRSRISAGGSTLYESADFAFVEDRDPLHVAINTYVRVISGVHTGQSQYAKFKFIACGLVAGEATSAKLATYSVSSDARAIWNTDLYAYWTASSLYDSSSPKLKNLGSTSAPMYLNSLGFADRADLPSAHIADAASTTLVSSNEQVQTPIDADVLIEVTVTAVDLFIEAHMPLVPEGDALISPIHYTLSDYTIDTDTSAVSNQLVSSFDAATTPVDPDVVSGVLSTASANATTPVDPDAIAGISSTATASARTPVDPDVVSGLSYEANLATQVVTDADVISLSEYGAITDARLIAFAKGLAGIDVSASEDAQAYFDADVSVIVNVTATDLDIEAHIPTVTDDVFLVEENNAQWADVTTPVDADVVVIVNVTTTDLDIEAHIPTVTDDVFLVQENNTASSQATAPVYNASVSDLAYDASVAPLTPIDADVPTSIDTASSADAQTPTQAAALTGLALTAYEASAYEYEGGVEQDYLQTITSGFMWSPNAAAGIETVNGTYTLFVKVMQLYPGGSWPFTAGGCLITTYDDTPTYPLQTIDSIAGSYYYEDVIQFSGYTSYNSMNYFFQTQYSWQTTPFVAAITVDTLAGTVTYRAFHKLYSVPMTYMEYLSEVRPPLHVSVNAYGLNFGAFHAGIAGGANMQFVAAGLIAGSVTDQQIQDYTNAKDARGIFGNDMRSYWVASTLQGDQNIDPFKSLPDLVGNNTMFVNGNIQRSGMFPIPKSNQFTADLGSSVDVNTSGVSDFVYRGDTYSVVQVATAESAQLPVSAASYLTLFLDLQQWIDARFPVEVDAFIDAFANSPNIRPAPGVGFAVSLISDGSADGPAAKIVVTQAGGLSATYVVRRR